MIKSSIRWSITLGLAVASLVGWSAAENLKAIALPEEEVLKKLYPIPVFTILDERGAPVVHVTEDEAQVAGIFFSQNDASEYVDLLKVENPELAEKVKVATLSLAEIHQIATSEENKDNALNFKYVPEKDELDSAKAVSEQTGQPFPGGVPLFGFTGGEEKGYVSFETNSQQVIPLFFEKAQLEEAMAQLKKLKPELAAELEIGVLSLNNVINILESDSDSDEIPEQIVLYPSSESVKFVLENSPIIPSGETPATPETTPEATESPEAAPEAAPAK